MADEPPTTPPTPPDEKPAFVAGLPEGPLWRPMCYDGPLVCPFYGPDHPARRDEESTEAFNEDVARAAFGDGEIDRLKELQQKPFSGDWWLLARLHSAITSADAIDAESITRQRFLDWTGELDSLRRLDVVVHLECADLFKSYLKHAILHNVHLEHARLFRAELQFSVLDESHLQNADLSMADVRHADLNRAQLQKTEFCGTDLRDADLSWANLQDADLSWAKLEQSQLRQARLDYCDLRNATGAMLDENHAHRLRIEGLARDPWSVLRRTYTGPRYVVHLALTLAFLLPFALTVANLGAIDQAYTALSEVAPTVGYRPELRDLPQVGLREVVGPRVIAESQSSVEKLVEQFDRHHTPAPAWWVLVGGLEAWYFAILSALVALYNLIRLIVMLGIGRWLVVGAEGVNTVGVTALREAEERSGVTPSLTDYYGPMHPLSEAFKERVLMWVFDDEVGYRAPKYEPARATCLWREWRWMASCWLRYDKDFPLMAIGLYRLHCIARVLFWLAVAAFVFRAAHWVLTATVPAPIDALL